MPRKSSISRLPAEIRELIGDLREQGRTIDEILAKLRELDVTVSRSSLGRHLKNAAEVGERIRRSREIADALVRRFGDAPESKTARLNIELMHSVVMDVVTAVEARGADEAGEPVTLDAMQVMLLSKALDHLGKASRSDADVIEKARQQVIKEVIARAIDAAEKGAAKAGVTLGREALDLIRRELELIK